jgi:hypothetical protein
VKVGSDKADEEKTAIKHNHFQAKLLAPEGHSIETLENILR